MNDIAYQQVARQINNQLKEYDNGNYQPRVSVVNVEKLPNNQGFDKLALFINNELAGLIEEKGLAQDLLYSDEVYTVTEPDGTDYDLYIEPMTGRYFDITKL